jgi:Tfp pilus assembly protein PilO
LNELHGSILSPWRDGTSPVVVVTTLLLIAAFVIGFGYQLLGLAM